MAQFIHIYDFSSNGYVNADISGKVSRRANPCPFDISTNPGYPMSDFQSAFCVEGVLNGQMSKDMASGFLYENEMCFLFFAFFRVVLFFFRCYF